MKHYGKLTLALIAGWFVFALSASALHLFRNNSQRVGIGVAIAALTPIIVFALWFALSESFRQFTLSLNPRILTGAQFWQSLRCLRAMATWLSERQLHSRPGSLPVPVIATASFFGRRLALQT